MFIVKQCFFTYFKLSVYPILSGPNQIKNSDQKNRREQQISKILILLLLPYTVLLINIPEYCHI